MNISVLPAGAWGTAMAIHLQRLGHTVTLVPRELDEALAMAEQRENKQFFPGHPLPQDLQIGMEPRPALMEADVLILACPSKFLRSVCREISEVLDSAWQLKIVVTLCKGLEEGTNKLPAEILAEELPDYPRGVLSGPTFASQVADGKPSALVFASNAEDPLKKDIQHAFSGQNVRIYTSSDLVGVELGGSLKNVYAIAAGICDGLGLGDNGKGALLTRALTEMVRLGTALGGRIETFYGLSGFGDLVLTCNGKESRNRTFGEELARGTSIEELIDVRKMTVEGYKTAACFLSLCEKNSIDAPIMTEINAVLYDGKSPAEALNSLMSRELKSE